MSAIDRWAASGAMALTGWPDRPPLGPPGPLVERLEHVAERLADRSGRIGRCVTADPLALLTERAAVAGLTRGGQISCGGPTQLVPSADGWLAVSLARPDDIDLVAAWLEVDDVPTDPWPTIHSACGQRSTTSVVDRGILLGLPIAALPVHPPASGDATELPFGAENLGDAPGRTALDGVVVVDLSSLWAGPLCGALLAEAGATVVKVESTRRPDGGRQGPVVWFDRLNAGKASVALDLATDTGRRQLHAVVRKADVVIEASRPRALEQLGIDAVEMVRTGPAVWVSLTGHGRTGDAAHRVGFGDDAAVAGGLVAWDGDDPVFCADAVADPCSGLVAATAGLDALASGGRWLIDVALAGVAAWLAGPTVPAPAGLTVLPPEIPPVGPSAPAFGADTDRVLAALGVDL